MKVESLRLTNFRGLKNLSLDFHPGLNVIAGVNGAGKSSIMQALAMLLWHAVDRKGAASAKVNLAAEDILLGATEAMISANITQNGRVEDITLQRTREEAELRQRILDKLKKLNAELKRNWQSDEQHEATKEEIVLQEAALKAMGVPKPASMLVKSGSDPKCPEPHEVQPLAILFTPKRQNVVEPRVANPKMSKVSAAFKDALRDRPLELKYFASWFRLKQDAAIEGSQQSRVVVDSLHAAIERFLPGFTNLRFEKEPTPGLLVDKNGTTLAFRQLSDGERGVLVMVMDIARRLGQANEKLRDPIAEGSAVVLLDELELHLHPRWQRDVVHRLTATFPKCQFIITTHSPQVIGEIKPESLFVLSDGKIVQPDQSFGMDTNWVLQHLQGAEPRERTTQERLQEVDRSIDEEQLEHAKVIANELQAEVGPFPELQEMKAMIDRLEILRDAED